MWGLKKNTLLIVITVVLYGCASDTTIERRTPDSQVAKPQSSALNFTETETAIAEIKALVEEGRSAEARQLASLYGLEARRSGPERARLLGLVVREAARQGDKSVFDAFIQQKIEADPQEGHWSSAWYVNWSVGSVASARSIHWLSENQPDQLLRLKTSKIWSAIRKLREEELDEEIYGLLRQLHSLGYEGVDEIHTTQGLTLELLTYMVERGEQESAQEIAMSTDWHSDFAMEIWVDRRFEDLWPSMKAAGKFDTHEMYINDWVHAQTALRKAVNLGWDAALTASLIAVQARRTINDIDEAEKTAFAILSMMPPEEQSGEDYAWLKNELAYVYEDQGKMAEALAVMQGFYQSDLTGKSYLISQVINYAAILHRVGKFEDALKVADDVLTNKQQHTSIYGDYWAMAIKVCALEGLGRLDDARPIFSQMNSAPKENYQAAVMAGLCLDEEDSVAELFKRRLEDPLYRRHALLALSSFPKRIMGERLAVLRERVHKIGERQDIQALIRSIGRTRSWDLTPVYWGHY